MAGLSSAAEADRATRPKTELMTKARPRRRGTGYGTRIRSFI
jgi:hypothetical protein